VTTIEEIANAAGKEIMIPPVSRKMMYSDLWYLFMGGRFVMLEVVGMVAVHR
jgi:hypothetical protein